MATTKPKQKGEKVRKVPQRRCVGCGGTFDKKDLLRIVRAPMDVQTPAETDAEPETMQTAPVADENIPAAERISIDFTGKKSGRGAYICPEVECLKKARKAKRLERIFETSVPDSVYEEAERLLSENDR